MPNNPIEWDDEIQSPAAPQAAQDSNIQWDDTQGDNQDIEWEQPAPKTPEQKYMEQGPVKKVIGALPPGPGTFLQFITGAEPFPQARLTERAMGMKEGTLPEFSKPVIEGYKGVVKAPLQLGQAVSDAFKNQMDKEGTLRKFSQGDWLREDLDYQKRKEAKPGIVKYLEDVYQMGPQIATQYASYMLGGKAATMGWMSVQIAGPFYEQLVREGVNPRRALIAAIANAAAQAPLEAIQLEFIVTKLGGPLFQRLAGGALTEFGTEWVQKYPELAAELWAKKEEVTWDKIVKATKEGIYEGLVAAPFGALGGVGKKQVARKIAGEEGPTDILTGETETTAKPGTRSWARDLINRVQKETPQPVAPEVGTPVSETVAPYPGMELGAPAVYGPEAAPRPQPPPPTRGGFGPQAKAELTTMETAKAIEEKGRPVYAGGAIVEPVTREITQAEMERTQQVIKKAEQKRGFLGEKTTKEITEKDFNDYVATLSESEKGYVEDIIKDTKMRPEERIALAKTDIVTRKKEAKIKYQKDLEIAQKETVIPTPAQIESGTYKKGRIKIHGFEGVIETPKGVERVPGIKVKHPVGYIRGVEGADGDQVDVIYGPEGEISDHIFVVDQSIGGKFDEHKAMMGFRTVGQARTAHKTTYGNTAQIMDVVKMTPREFKVWAKTADKTKPASQEPPISERQWLQDPSVRPPGYSTKKYLPSAKGRHAVATNRTVLAEYRQWLRNMGYSRPSPTQKQEAPIRPKKKDTRSLPTRALSKHIMDIQANIRKKEALLPESKKTKGEIMTAKDEDFQDHTDLNKEQKLTMWLAKVFGVDLSFYVGPRMGGSGVFVEGPNTISIHAETDKPYTFVLMHEIIHNMEAEDPKTWNELNRYLWSVKNDIEFGLFADAINESLPPNKQLPLNPFLKRNQNKHTVWHEFMAEGIAHRVFSEEFWNKLQKRNPSLFSRFVAYITKVFNKIKEKMSATRTQNLAYFKDFEGKTMDEITKALTAFAERKVRAKQIQAYESIVAAAMRYKGKIYTGVTHAEAFQKIEDEYGEKINWNQIEDDGFLTNKGKFISRDEAQLVAAWADQIQDIDQERGYLVSEALRQRKDVVIPRKELIQQKDIKIKDKDLKPGKLPERTNKKISRALATEQKYTLKDIAKLRLSNKWPKFVNTEKEYSEMALKAAEANIKHKTWMENHNQLLMDTLGDDWQIFNAILAVTSPMAPINQNAGWAAQTYLYLLGLRDKPGAMFPNDLIKTKLNEWLAGKFAENMGKSENQKVQEWTRALLGDPNATTNDRWMYRAFFGEYTKKGDIQFTTMENVAARHMLTRVAKRLSGLGKEKWTISQVQSSIWAYIKSRIEGWDLKKQEDYFTAMNTKLKMLGNMSAVEYLESKVDPSLLKQGPLMELLDLKTIEFSPISELEKKRLYHIGEHGPEISKVDKPEDLKRYISELKKSKYSYVLTIPTYEELKRAVDRGAEVYMTDDRSAGYVIDDGDLQKLFSNSEIPGLGSVLLMDAMAKGARTLDCFDPYLPAYYGMFGWEETERSKFNPEYAPDNWPKSAGTPDVVFMKLNDSIYKELQNVKSERKKIQIIRERIGGFKNNWERITPHVERVSVQVGAKVTGKAGESVRIGVDQETRIRNTEELARSGLEKVGELIQQRDIVIPNEDIMEITEADEIRPAWYSDFKNYVDSKQFRDNIGKGGASAKKIKMLLTQAMRSKAKPFREEEWEWSSIGTWLDTVDDDVRLTVQDVLNAYDEYAIQFVEKWRMDSVSGESLSEEDYEERFSDWLKENFWDSAYDSELENYEIFDVPDIEDIHKTGLWGGNFTESDKDVIDKVFFDFSFDQLKWFSKKYTEKFGERIPDDLIAENGELYKKVENDLITHREYLDLLNKHIKENYPNFYKFLSDWEGGLDNPILSIYSTEWNNLQYAGPSDYSGSDWFPHGGGVRDFSYSWLNEDAEDVIQRSAEQALEGYDWAEYYYDFRDQFEESTGYSKTPPTGTLVEGEPESLKDVERFPVKWKSKSYNIPGGENYREVQVMIKSPTHAGEAKLKELKHGFQEVYNKFSTALGLRRELYMQADQLITLGKYEEIGNMIEFYKYEDSIKKELSRPKDRELRVKYADKVFDLTENMLEEDLKILNEYKKKYEKEGTVFWKVYTKPGSVNVADTGDAWGEFSTREKAEAWIARRGKSRKDQYIIKKEIEPSSLLPDPSILWDRYASTVMGVQSGFMDKILALNEASSEVKIVERPKTGWRNSTHWGDDVDVVYWIRFDTRYEKTKTGQKKILYIQEIQSDWIQQGSSKGFAKDYKIGKKGKAKKTTYREMVERYKNRNLADAVFYSIEKNTEYLRMYKDNEITKEEFDRLTKLYKRYSEPKRKTPVDQNEELWVVMRGNKILSASPIESFSKKSSDKFVIFDKSGQPVKDKYGTDRYREKEFDKERDAMIYIQSEIQPIPTSPLIERYFIQAYRRMVRYAAESGHDMIGMTTGQQQVDRWNGLLQSIGHVVYNEESKKLKAYSTGGELITEYENVNPTDLRDYMGKTSADKLLNSEKQKNGDQRLNDIKIGGQFLRKFYDKIMPRSINKIFNKKSWGNAELRAWEHTTTPSGEILPQSPYYDMILKERPSGQQIVKTRLYDLDSAGGNLLLEFRSIANVFIDGMASREAIGLEELNKRNRDVLNARNGVNALDDEMTSLIYEFKSADIGYTSYQELGRRINDIESRAKQILRGYFKNVNKSKSGQPIRIDYYIEPLAEKFDMYLLYAKQYSDAFLEASGEFKKEKFVVEGVEEIDNINKIPDMLRNNIPVYVESRNKEAIGLINRMTDPMKNVAAAKEQGFKLYTIKPNQAISESIATWIMPITEKMRSKALTVGFPIFNTDLKSEIPAVTKKVIENKIGPAGQTMLQRIKASLDDFRRNFVTRNIDRLHPIKQWLGETKAYMLARGIPGIQSTVQAFLEHGKLRFDKSGAIITDEVNNGFLHWYDQLGNDAEKFFYWVVAKRAQSLKKENREFLFDDKDIKAILSWVGEKPTDSKYASWEDINTEFKEFNNNILDIAQRSGLIDKGFRDYMANQGYYVPFYRVLTDPETRVLFTQNKLRPKEIGAQIRKLSGSELPIGDPVENMLKNWSHLISESAHNVARRSAFNEASRRKLVAYQKEDDKGKLVDVPLVEQVSWADTVRFKKIGKEKGAPVFISKKDGMPVLQFRAAGKSIYFKVNDTELFNALGQMDVQSFDNIWSKIGGVAKMGLTYGATFGPAFRIKNFLRDTLHTFQISKGFVPLWDSIAGLWKVWTNNPDYIQFMASGMAFGGSYVREGDASGLHKYVKSIVKKEGQGALRRIISTPMDALNWWKEFGEGFENAARVQLYSRLKKKGLSHLEAAFNARDLMDFNMSGNGTAVRVLISTVPFMNARIQGLYKMGRAAVDNPTSFFTKSAMIAMASMLLWWLNKDDDRYKELEDFEKFAWYHFWIGDKHFRIPKPFETGVLFSTSVEMAGDVITGNEELNHVMDYINHAFLETLAMNPTPQAIRPIWEQVANKTFFTGRPIEPMGMKYREPGERFDPWNSETLRFAGQAINVSPKRMEHLVRGYLSVFGSFILGLSDIMVRSIADIDRPTKRLDDYPFIGAFVREADNPRYTKYMSSFFDALNEARKVTAQLNAYNREGDFKKAQEYARKKQSEIRMAPRLNMTYKQISDISTEMKRTWTNPNMTPDQKKAHIDKLTNMRNRLVKQVYDQILRRK